MTCRTLACGGTPFAHCAPKPWPPLTHAYYTFLDGRELSTYLPFPASSRPQRSQALAAIASIASAAANLVSDSARDVFLQAAKAAASGIKGGSSGGSSDALATQLCQLLAASLPSGASAGASSSGRRALQQGNSGSDPVTMLQEMLSVGSTLVQSMGQQVRPCCFCCYLL